MQTPFRLLLLALVAAGVSAGCSKHVPVTEEIRPVRAVTIAPSPTVATVELAGEIRPRVESRVGFQVGGRIARRHVEVGQSVRAGQALATLDGVDYKLSAAAASAQLAAAKVDRDQQRVDFKRFEELHQQGFISGADLERRKATLDAAEARYEQAAAQADVSTNQASYAVLRAPVNGVVAVIDAEMGQVVAAGQSVVRIAQTGEKEVAIALPENHLQALRGVQDVRVKLWANDKELRGRVREIAPIADAATRTYPTRITLIDAPPSVALGMTATVTFEMPAQTSTIVVPLQALLRDGDATYAWKVDRSAMTVHRTRIDVAGIDGNDLIIGTGVAPGDQIVTAGVHLLKEGQKVRLLDTGAPGTPAQPDVKRVAQAKE
jgi:RND family efflux transporter MFP subunit